MASSGKFGLAFGNKAPNATASLVELSNNDLNANFKKPSTPNSVIVKGSEANRAWYEGKGSNATAADTASTATDYQAPATNYYQNYQSGGGGGYSRSSGGGSSSSVTDKQKKSAENQKALAQFEAQNTRDKLAEKFDYYDKANQSLRQYADAQRVQNEMRAGNERFEAQRDMLDSLFSLRNRAGQSLNGSAAYDLMDIARDTNDRRNATHWDTLRKNNDAVENSYMQAYNQNQLSRIDAQIDARKNLADLEANLAANLNNIDSSLFELPTQKGSTIDLLGRNANKDKANAASLSNSNAEQSGYTTSGYSIPDRKVEGIDPLTTEITMGRAGWEPYVMGDRERARIQPGRISGDDYFSRLINYYNGYRS